MREGTGSGREGTGSERGGQIMGGRGQRVGDSVYYANFVGCICDK